MPVPATIMSRTYGLLSLPATSIAVETMEVVAALPEMVSPQEAQVLLYRFHREKVLGLQGACPFRELAVLDCSTKPLT